LRDGKAYHTGYYLDELAIPLSKLIDAGYTPVFADPSGEPTTFDPVSNDKMFFRGDDATRAQAISFLENLKALQKPKTLKAVLIAGTSDYVGIFIPGGHAPMQDLVADKTLGQILTAFHDASKPTGIHLSRADCVIVHAVRSGSVSQGDGSRRSDRCCAVGLRLALRGLSSDRVFIG
jgi:putative intracellular protease/amidase